ncbi:MULTISPECIES: NAD(P)-dependent alcohol dehydrogenase [Acidobacteriaceae]|uniref:NAD(P)-dependent alcohol dehydrogenase n=1 Tax=Acidobacteriaceae TaxID=204434 RepID=UPI00131B9149|nr:MULTISPECIES: NAD(P)-dependent alcohol dehydrogenase [Acidobacteriaceae]MDW5267961.1 NAD(P)-dependent alcohol dehydrogenase [Edaphobacter sp.]
MKSHGYAAHDKKSPLVPFNFDRREPGPNDVVVEIAYSGICHSDIHQVRDEWNQSIYPMVPGHEIVGHVTAVGSAVTKFKKGDLAGVGVMVDSCRICENCKAEAQPYCVKGMVGTYNARDYKGELTFGGYANNIVVDEKYTHTISPKLNLAAVAPLLCAGITTYSPLRHWKAGKGKKVGVVGLGGLGHMGLKFAHSFGAHVVQFTTSESKIEDAKKLGADEVVISKDASAMAKHAGSFDFILDCVAAEHNLNDYLNLLRLDGTLCSVGLPEQPLSITPFAILANRRSLSGSMIGGMAETQDMLDYCAEHNIVSDIELTPIQNLPEAYERVVKGDVKYRFVIDMATLPAQ